MRHFRQRRSGVNLKEELKALMFPLSGPVCITEDEELFKNAMITFYQHELAVSYVCVCICVCMYVYVYVYVYVYMCVYDSYLPSRKCIDQWNITIKGHAGALGITLPLPPNYLEDYSDSSPSPPPLPLPQAQKDGSRPGDSGVVFRKLSKHLDEQFSRDFPFYLLVAYRVHKYVLQYTYVHTYIIMYTVIQTSPLYFKYLCMYSLIQNFQ